METHAAEAETPQNLGEIEKLLCEHQIRQMDCDECRYELGLVKVAADSPAASMLKTQAVVLRTMVADADAGGTP